MEVIYVFRSQSKSYASSAIENFIIINKDAFLLLRVNELLWYSNKVYKMLYLY